jgi:ribonuclease VapC
MNAYLLNSCAVLALLQKESGSEMVEEILEAGGCSITVVNYSEVFHKLLEKGFVKEKIHSALDRLSLQIISPDRADGETAAAFYPQCKKLGLSLADRFCLAVAKNRSQIVITSDQSWSKLHGSPPIKFLRPK